MSKQVNPYVWPNGAPDVLGVRLTYEQFLDLMTDAWLAAGKYEQEPHPMFRKALFYNMDKFLAAASPSKEANLDKGGSHE